MTNLDIFTTHKFSMGKCPPNLKHNLQKWDTLNQSYGFRYYDDADIDHWMLKNTDPRTYDMFKKLNSGAGRADLFRICHLYFEGGVWVDADLPAFDIDQQYSEFKQKLYQYEAILVRNRKCNNPRYTFIASQEKNSLFLNLIDFINEKIQKTVENSLSKPTIHITGPFVLHDLLCKINALSEISQLEIEKTYFTNGSSFRYIDDIVPERSTYQEENVYPGYEEDLKFMGVVPHNLLSAVKTRGA